MKPYPEISNLYKRDIATGKARIGRFSHPEYEYLWNAEWQATEKIDGVNTRIIWHNGEVSYHDRRDRGTLPPALQRKLRVMVTKRDLSHIFPDFDVCLYGEGYGNGIGKNGHHYLANDVGFILFDIFVPDPANVMGGWWLQRPDLEDIATKLCIPIVPIINSQGQQGVNGDTMSLPCAVRRVSGELKSQFGDFTAEGLVLKPAQELYLRNGTRIIVKVKGRDY